MNGAKSCAGSNNQFDLCVYAEFYLKRTLIRNSNQFIKQKE